MKNLRVVLVKSKYPRNVGMVSRIMCNFNVEKLILVSPQCEMNEEAKQGAAQGQKPLSDVKIYSDWIDFYENEPEGLRVAFSRRQGKRRASEPWFELMDDPIIDHSRPTYLIFGAEDHGLSADDLEMVHRLAYFDLPGDLQSMNLSHSVLYALLSFFQRHGYVEANEVETNESIKDPTPFLELWLKTLNFDLESQSRWNALTMLKQLVMKASPTNDEIHKLEMIVQHTVRKLKGL